MQKDKKTPADFLKDPEFLDSIPSVFSRGIRRRKKEVLELKPPKYLDDCFPDEPMPDSLPDGEPLHQFENLQKFRERYPYFEDRSAKIAFLSARCPMWLKEDFDFICRTVEGEDPAVVIRRLAREYVRHNTPC